MARVLVVDDEISIRITLKEFIKDAGFEVEVAENAEIAMDMLAAENFDVVIADIIMPRITGVELLKAIKQELPNVVVILMTGEPTVETASEAVRAEAFDYLPKPIEKNQVVKTITNAVRFKELDDDRRRLLGYNHMYQNNLEKLVTERTAELRESEERFRSLSQTAADAIISIDSYGRILYLNTAAQSMFDVTTEKMIGQKLTALIPDRYRERHEQGLARLRSGDDPRVIGHTVELHGLCSDGTEFPIELSLSSWRVKGKIYFSGIIRDITERVQAGEAIQQYIHQMDSLNKIDQAITSGTDLISSLDVLLEHLVAHLEVNAAAVLHYQEDNQILTFAHGKGFHTAALQHTELQLGKGYAGNVAMKKSHLFIPDLKQDESDFLDRPNLTKENFVSYYGIPLIAKGNLIGVLEVFHRSDLNPNDEWEDYLKLLAQQAAIALDNHTMFKDLQRSNEDLILAYDATIEGWARALEMRDMETEGHSRRVVDLTMKLAIKMGISDDGLVHIRRGALLHDIGKMAVPDAILQNPGKLNDEEWEVMRQHPLYAYKWLSPIEYLQPALDIPHYHHEKWDGTGYLRGMQGERIPLSARIFAIVDVWDALNSDRYYRKAWPKEKVVTYIQEESGKHFDPQVAESFLEIVRPD